MSVTEVDPLSADKEVVEYLEYLLERAKSGEIQSVAVVVGKAAYNTANGWAGMSKNNMAMVGELEALKIDIMRYFVEQRIEYVEESRE